MATSKRRIVDQRLIGMHDLRETPLYKEAEALFQQVLRPGSGRPTSAVDIMVRLPGKKVACALVVIDGGRYPVAAACRVLGVARSNIARRRARGAHLRDARGHGLIFRLRSGQVLCRYAEA